jgi:DNA-directed RNA polymerase specialized sigma24 family protein
MLTKATERAKRSNTEATGLAPQFLRGRRGKEDRLDSFTISEDLDSFSQDDGLAATTECEKESNLEKAEKLNQVWSKAHHFSKTLTKKQREAFNLHYGRERLSLSQMAKRLSISQQAVEFRLRDALARIKEAINPGQEVTA